VIVSECRSEGVSEGGGRRDTLVLCMCLCICVVRLRVLLLIIVWRNVFNVVTSFC
jgi:hypothetical protein